MIRPKHKTLSTQPQTQQRTLHLPTQNPCHAAYARHPAGIGQQRTCANVAAHDCGARTRNRHTRSHISLVHAPHADCLLTARVPASACACTSLAALCTAYHPTRPQTAFLPAPAPCSSHLAFWATCRGSASWNGPECANLGRTLTTGTCGTAAHGAQKSRTQRSAAPLVVSTYCPTAHCTCATRCWFKLWNPKTVPRLDMQVWWGNSGRHSAGCWCSQAPEVESAATRQVSRSSQGSTHPSWSAAVGNQREPMCAVRSPATVLKGLRAE